jgi:hypothetical protein
MLNFGSTLLRILSKSVVRNNGKSPVVVQEFESNYYYNDLRYLIHRVNSQIKSGEKIDDQSIMEPVKDRYPCFDVLTCLSSYVKLKDEKLKELTDRFVENAVQYGCSFCVPVKSIAESSNSEIEWGEDTAKRVKHQRLSNRLTKAIAERVGHLLVN